MAETDQAGVETVEQTVKTVVEPVYLKIHGMPSELLYLVDNKVDDTICKVDEYLPPTVKQVTYQVYDITKQAPSIGRSIVSELHSNGIIGTVSQKTKILYSRYELAVNYVYVKYEPIAEQWTLFVWDKLLKLPLFPQLVHIFIPTATYCSEKYNHVVLCLADNQYQIAAFLPLVPVEKIKKALERSLEANEARNIETSATT
ncbi:hypothetical protein SUGI_0185940 [Cryptomeria japonica]|nr:hypothetical protein SUGI_0185940 [Cryptomeria japonica]